MKQQIHQANCFWGINFGSKSCETIQDEENEEVDEVKTFQAMSLKYRWKGYKIKLYQYQNCPFCSKVRAFFQAYDIPFEMIEVHPIFKKEVEFSQYKKLPIVTIEKNGEIYVGFIS